MNPIFESFTKRRPYRSWISPYNYVQNNPVMRQDPTGMLDVGVSFNFLPYEKEPFEPHKPDKIIIADEGEHKGEFIPIYMPDVVVTAERVNKQTDPAVALPASIADQTKNALTIAEVERFFLEARLNEIILSPGGADAVLNSSLPDSYKKDALIWKTHHGETAQFGLAFMNGALKLVELAMGLRMLGYNAPEIGFSPSRSFVSFADDVVINQVDDVAARGSKYAFGLKNVVPKFADDIGAIHLMKDPNWKSSFMKAINNPNNKLHFNLNGIDSKPMQMIMSPGRSGINWEMNALYQNSAAFERTIFHYGGNTYKGFDVFKITP